MSHFTCHTSYITPHTSHVTRHTSHVTRHTSHVTRHTSHVLHQVIAHALSKFGCILWLDSSFELHSPLTCLFTLVEPLNPEPQVSVLKPQTSHMATNAATFNKMDCYSRYYMTLHVTCHTSHVTCHTSHVTRHLSHVTRHTSHVTQVNSWLFPSAYAHPATLAR